MRWSILTFSFLLPLSAHACPDLQSFYQYDDDVESQIELESALAPLMSECLRSPEFFALYGAALMETGKLSVALEMLERALLLDANNGSALIDYAQALYLRGQLFSALDLNQQLSQRQDLPANIATLVAEREERWRRDTRAYGVQLDVLAGFDNNLNGAPDPNQITLTLSGEPVILTLNPEFQAISGPYLNLRLGGQFQQLASDHQHNVTGEIRSRISEDAASDLIQASAHYNYLLPKRDNAWQFGGGMSHLFFGGNPLYTAVDSNVRYQKITSRSCTRRYELAGQYQLYNDQSRLNSIESKLSAGLDCPVQALGLPTLLGGELAIVHSAALKDGRPGGDRLGWQFNLAWQFPLLGGMLTSQLSHTELDDQKGYSALLDDGAQRWVKRSFALLQYRQMLQPNLAFMFNIYHQNQHSNIELFDSVDSTLELGISASF